MDHKMEFGYNKVYANHTHLLIDFKQVRNATSSDHTVSNIIVSTYRN